MLAYTEVLFTAVVSLLLLCRGRALEPGLKSTGSPGNSSPKVDKMANILDKSKIKTSGAFCCLVRVGESLMGVGVGWGWSSDLCVELASRLVANLGFYQSP